MPFRSVLVQAALALCFLAAANVGVAWLSRNSVPRQLIRKGLLSERASDLFLGNSTMAAGLDEAAFAAAKPGSRPLNLGMGASSSVEHYLIFRQQIKHRGAMVYYGFFDNHLTIPDEGSWGTLVGNRAMAYYVEPDIALEFYAADSPILAFAMRLVGHVPMLVERQTIWAKVEKVRRFFGEIGMPKQAANRFGRVEDFALLEGDPIEFAKACQRATADRAPLTASVAAILDEARQRDGKVYLVEMPMPAAHRQKFNQGPAWVAYHAYLIELIRAAGAHYVCASDWIDDSKFADHVHLDDAGAQEFSQRLAIYLADR